MIEERRSKWGRGCPLRCTVFYMNLEGDYGFCKKCVKYQYTKENIVFNPMARAFASRSGHNWCGMRCGSIWPPIIWKGLPWRRKVELLYVNGLSTADTVQMRQKAAITFFNIIVHQEFSISCFNRCQVGVCISFTALACGSLYSGSGVSLAQALR